MTSRTFAAFVALAATFGAATLPAIAQEAAEAEQPEISESHMQAARAAVEAIGATEDFDGILPEAARALQTQLVQRSPNLQDEIAASVRDVAISLAPRRADLEREAARIFAGTFSEEELAQITEFYNSEAGQKLIEQGPVVTRDVMRAADIWQQGIARDLARGVNEALQPQGGAAGEGQTESEAEGGAASE